MKVDAVQIQTFETRVLLPFLLDYRKANELREVLLGQELMGKNIWEPHELGRTYTDNVFPHLALYRRERPTSEQGFALRIDDFVIDDLQPLVDDQTGLAARVLSRHGIELFISPYGGGLLSLSLAPSGTDYQLSDVVDFHRRIHFGREWLELEPERVLPMQTKLEGAHPPIENIPTLFEAILAGALPGGAAEDRFGVSALQRSYSIYTTVRLGQQVDFGDEQWRSQLASPLHQLQAVWPGDHCGLTLDADFERQRLLLNRKHWLAVGNMGVSHFVADQSDEAGGGSHRFNERRLTTGTGKMFFQYLIALSQKMALQAFAREAITLSDPAQAGSPRRFLEQLAPHKQTLLHFALRGYSRAISEEETSVRFYNHCREVFAIDAEYARLDEVFADVESELRTREIVEQGQATTATLEAQNKLREKVEWVEVVIVTVYSVELAHVIGEGFAPHEAIVHSWLYPGTSLAVVAFVTLGAMISALGLWPDEQVEHLDASEDRPDSDPLSSDTTAAAPAATDPAAWLRVGQQQTAPQATDGWAGAAMGRLISYATYIGRRAVAGRRRWALMWICLAVTAHVLLGLWHLQH